MIRRHLLASGAVLAIGAILMGCSTISQSGQTKPAANMVNEICASKVTRTDRGVVVCPSNSGAHPVRVEAYSDTILRVTATPDQDWNRTPSLMVADLTRPAAAFTVTEQADKVILATKGASAEIARDTGAVTFKDASGKVLVAENPVRSFKPVTLGGKTFYAVHQTFASRPDEGIYGLGQQQNGQYNLNGEDVELAQHNIQIAMPVLATTGGYGIVWDNNSISRYGDPRPYAGLGAQLIVRGADGAQGGLSGQYWKGGKIVANTRETDPDYQFIPPEEFMSGQKVRNVYPQPLGATAPDKVEWTGSLEARTSGVHKFRVYASNYVKVWVDGKLVVDRWRQNWNPYYFNFETEMVAGQRKDVRVEWLPNEGYFRMLHLDPMPAQQRREVSLSSEAGELIDYYLVAGKSIDEQVAGFHDLTGRSVMLPKWAYGFWQSRQRYKTQDELLGALKGYRDRKIPIDNIVLDWFYWPEDQWGSHDFDKARFPDAKAMVEEVHKMNGRVMISVWPKFYPTTDNYKELDKAGAMYQGNIERKAKDWVGPGYANSFYDPYSAKGREIYWRQMREKLDTLGFDAWWLDATEPDLHSNLSLPERSFRQGPTAMGPAEEHFNSYVLMSTKAVYEGERAGANPDDRVFILTRSGFPGVQRHGAAVWSGDVVARWDDLREQITAGTGISMSGQANWTFDIGGFAVEDRYTNEDPAHLAEWRELNLRWFQFGAFVPLFRSHGEYPFREIYNLAPAGSEVYDSLTWYTRLRYRLLPYIYSLAGDTYERKSVMMRGLVMDFPNDPLARNLGDQYMFGPSFLVAPVYQHQARTRKVYLPANSGWYDFYTGAHQPGGRWIEAEAPLSRMPLFVRAGAILPIGPEIQHTAEPTDGSLTLNVYTGADGSFDLYEDDGLTYAYERGASSRIPLRWDQASGTLTIGAKTGSYTAAPSRTLRVRWITPGSKRGYDPQAPADVSVTYTGGQIVVKKS